MGFPRIEDRDKREVISMGSTDIHRLLAFGLVSIALAVFALPTAAQQRKKIVIDTELEVEGQVQKPQVTYIVTRQDVEDEESLDLSKSFIPRIVASVEKEPF
jgi:hypothetical protein